MAQKDTHAEKSATFNFPAGLGELGQKRVETMMEVQKGLFDEAKNINQRLLERAKSDADLAAELVNKLTAAHSVPEALSIWQQWTRRRMEMAVEDGQWALANGFKLIETGARLFANGGATTSTT